MWQVHPISEIEKSLCTAIGYRLSPHQKQRFKYRLRRLSRAICCAVNADDALWYRQHKSRYICTWQMPAKYLVDENRAQVENSTSFPTQAIPLRSELCHSTRNEAHTFSPITEFGEQLSTLTQKEGLLLKSEYAEDCYGGASSLSLARKIHFCRVFKI